MPLRHETGPQTTTTSEHIDAPRCANNSRDSQRAQPSSRFGGSAGVIAPAGRWRIFRSAVGLVDDVGSNGGLWWRHDSRAGSASLRFGGCRKAELHAQVDRHQATAGQRDYNLRHNRCDEICRWRTHRPEARRRNNHGDRFRSLTHDRRRRRGRRPAYHTGASPCPIHELRRSALRHGALRAVDHRASHRARPAPAQAGALTEGRLRQLRCRAAAGTRDGSPGPFFSAREPLYWGCRRKPAMAINGRRNKPIGPGGSTRRLHPCGSVSPARRQIRLEGPNSEDRTLRTAPAGAK